MLFSGQCSIASCYASNTMQINRQHKCRHIVDIHSVVDIIVTCLSKLYRMHTKTVHKCVQLTVSCLMCGISCIACCQSPVTPNARALAVYAAVDGSILYSSYILSNSAIAPLPLLPIANACNKYNSISNSIASSSQTWVAQNYTTCFITGRYAYWYILTQHTLQYTVNNHESRVYESTIKCV